MNWNERKKLYDEAYLQRQNPHGTFSAHKDIAQEMIDCFNPRMVLDCGCGSGWLVDALNTKGVECYGVDINKSAIEHGQTRYSHIVEKFICADMAMENLPYSDGYFDLVIAREFLEHIDDEYLFLAIREMMRVCKSYLYVTTPTVYSDMHGAEWSKWLQTLNNNSLDENFKLIGEHPDLKRTVPVPHNQEHPNTHCREFWITLFDLLGFRQICFDDKYYLPLRYDSICGFGVMSFERK
jgi:SAM-dependent methyltransferase